MIPDGLVALNGVPGSGKTLDAVTIALEHYKRENRYYKYLLSYVKHKILNFIDSNKILSKFFSILGKFFKFWLVRIFMFFIKCFVNLFLFIALFKGFDFFTKFLIIIYFLYFRKLFKFFKNLNYRYYLLFKDKRINNVYSSFPILLDKKRNIWSRKSSIFDLNGDYSFYPNSLLITDEIQLFIDSDEYKDKVKADKISKIAKFLQAHRHFGIKQIIFTSQSPTRIFKKARNIVVGYLKQSKLINLPFGISIMRGILYYDFDCYGKFIPKSREERKKLAFEYKKVFKIFNRNKAFSAYDSRYLSEYNYNKPLLTKGSWSSYKVPYKDLEDLFLS